MESVCIFGSTARGNSDGLSDKDVLIVSDCRDRRTALGSEWAEKGWSVAAYSPSRLRSISDHGGLFVQHLKQEGIIVLDPQRWLTVLLSGYSPRPNYHADLKESFELLTPLSRQLNGYWENLFKGDVLYIFMRNAGIYELANRQIYEFSYGRIVEILSDLKGISKNKLDALLYLRRLKSSYREREHGVDAVEDLHAAIGALQSMFAVNIESKLPAHYWVRYSKSPYSVLRDLEARLISTLDVEELDRFAVAAEIGVYWRIITDPRAYSWRIRGFSLRELVEVNHLLDVLMRKRLCNVPEGQRGAKLLGNCV